MRVSTADLCDRYSDKINVVEPIFKSYGGLISFGGKIATVKVHEDNVLMKNSLQERSAGGILVVDGGGSLRCALLGDQMAELALKNNWVGILINGCVRDTRALAKLPLGVLALNSHPHRSTKKGVGDWEVPVRFGGVTFTPGHYLYADEDGIITADKPLI